MLDAGLIGPFRFRDFSATCGIFPVRDFSMKWLAFALLVSVCCAQICLGAEESSPLGQKIPRFTLRDHRGAKHSLDVSGKNRATVIVMLGAECPLVKLYGPRLAQLAVRTLRAESRLHRHRLQPPGFADRYRHVCP